MTEPSDVSPYPEASDTSDYLQPLSKAAAGIVPFAGSLLAELIERYWMPALVRRREDWLRSLGVALNDLIDRVDGVEEHVQSSEEFLTIVLRAATAAQETHEREKLEALRAAVLNSALQIDPDEQVQLIFISMIDRLTAAHLQLLSFLHDPVAAFQVRGLDRPNYATAGISSILEQAFPWKREFYDLLAADLNQAGLVDVGLHVTMTGEGIWHSRTTEFGKRFLRFITEPHG